MNKLIRLITASLIISTFFSMTVLASGNATFVEVHENETSPEIFVKGLGEGDIEATAIVGNTECTDISVSKISDGNIYIDTLILIDNSMSVPQKSLDQIKEIVIQLVGARMDGVERFSVTTYSESVGTISEFSADYQSIHETIDQIERNDQDTRLTDAVAGIIKSGLLDDDDECSYRRIIIFSDGVDDQGGYSKTERDALLNESKVPIYTIGVYDNSGKNDASLTNMFSLSRDTGAAYFLLSDKDAGKVNVLVDGDNCYQVKDASEWGTIANVLNEDRGIVRFDVGLVEDVMDGSTKTVTLKIKVAGSEESITVDNVRMPQVVIEKKEEPVKEIVVEKEVKVVEKEETPVSVPEEPSFLEKYLYVIIAAIVLLIAIVVGVVIFIIKSASNKKKKNEAITEEEFDPFVAPSADEGPTVILSGGAPGAGSDGKTVQIFNQQATHVITLTDVNSPAKIYQKPIKDKIIIGRDSSVSDITIENDKAISHKHCSIERRYDRYYLKDLQSGNGTYLGQNRVLSEIEIYSGNTITLGRTKLKVEIN